MENFPLENNLVYFLPPPPDKLTGLLPVLGPGPQGAPLPKVAAHVTGVAPLAELPPADGENPLARYRVTYVIICVPCRWEA